LNLLEKQIESFNKNGSKSSKFLRKKSAVLMFSGGIDSTALLKELLVETDESLYVHHIHLKTGGWENRDYPRYKKEAESVRKIVPYMKKTFRNFNYTESTMDVRQIMGLLPDYYEMEDSSLIKFGIVPDMVFYSFFGGLLSKITNSDTLYTGICVEDFLVDRWGGIEEYQVEPKWEFIMTKILSGVSYPHELPKNAKAAGGGPSIAEIDGTISDKKGIKNIDLREIYKSKKQEIEYLGKELMDMVWYCRGPIEKNGEFVVCHECHTCKQVDAALSEKE